jgi:hypothetical protein
MAFMRGLYDVASAGTIDAGTESRPILQPMVDAAPPRRRRGPGNGPGRPQRDPDPHRMPPKRPPGNGNGGDKKRDEDEDRLPEVPPVPPVIPPPHDRPPIQNRRLRQM